VAHRAGPVSIKANLRRNDGEGIGLTFGAGHGDTSDSSNSITGVASRRKSNLIRNRTLIRSKTARIYIVWATIASEVDRTITIFASDKIH
jgi:hypothetical protein